MRHDNLLRSLLACMLAAGGPLTLQAQVPETLPPDTLPLQDMSAFASSPDNWRVVGDASAPAEGDPRIHTDSGTGVLVNVARSGSGENLTTAWEHGDIDLELEVMLPPESNSGIYLQGRYELQLLDSWRVQDPTYGDMGGIYQRWDESRGAGREGYEGYAPRVNAARAPGLWQTLRVQFQAPRFDAEGRKVANARFERVELNGAVLHENVELSGPTRGASLPGEAASGPLVIQGDHGPIAFRAIRFKRYQPAGLELSELAYRVYEGDFRRLPDAADLPVARAGSTRSLSTGVAGVADRFALVHEGTIEVPAAGEYLLDLRLNWLDSEGSDGVQGGARLLVAGREVLRHDGRNRVATARAELPAGRHPIVLELFKNREGRPASFTLFAEGPGVERQALHTESGPQRQSATGPILLEPGDEPYLLRGFLEHGEDKRTHVISVGEPDEIHYSYDAEYAAPIVVWRGPFLETTQMWEGRGEPQLAEPLGSVVELAAGPSIARLGGSSAAWPDSMPEDAGYRFLGYDLEDRRPVFRFRLAGMEAEDRIRPTDDRRGFTRELRLGSEQEPAGLFLRLATGEAIEQVDDETYIIDGGYYVVLRSDSEPSIRQREGMQELLLPLQFRRGAATVSYDIVW